jgi:hypothetical protein
MRLKVVVGQTYVIQLRGHGPGAVRELERLKLQDVLTAENLNESLVRFETMNGDFSYELADLPMPGTEPGSDHCPACRELR